MSAPLFSSAILKSRAFGIMERDLSEGLGHAYMIISPDDDVVDEIFTLAAMKAYCKNGGTDDCAECRRILHGNHPDIVHIYPDAKGKIKVEDIKELIDKIDYKSFSGRKLYFIHRADLMNVQAQNKMLKTFEEPPADATVFLGVANEAGILETIKSRARKIYIDSFDFATVRDAMMSIGIDEQTSAIAAECSEGMLGKARKIAASPQYIELYDVVLDMLEHLQRSGNVAELDGKAAQKDLTQFFDVLSIIIRDMILAKSDESAVLSKHVANRISVLGETYSERALAAILMRINEERKKLALNVGKIATIDDLLFYILEVRHKWQS